jgi:hypothetical protein
MKIGGASAPLVDPTNDLSAFADGHLGSALAFDGGAFTLFLTLDAREGADSQAVVCPLLRGSSPTRWVAPKQHRAELT